MKRRNRDGTAEWFTSFFDAAYVAQLREEKPPAQTRREVDFLLRALRPAPGARILDVPCGYGRHAAALAGRGFQVVGVDLSRAMIAEARRRFAGRPRLTFVRGDMRRITFDREFDAVVNLYTSFGYFTPAQNQAVLRRLARALRPGGHAPRRSPGPGLRRDAAAPPVVPRGRHPFHPGRPALRSPHPDHRERPARHRSRAAPGPAASPALPAVLARPVAPLARHGRAPLPARVLGLRRAALSRGRDRASHRGRGAAAPP